MSYVYRAKPTIDKHRADWVARLLPLVFMLLVTSGFFRLQFMQERLEQRFLRTHYASSILPAHRGNIFVRDGADMRRVALAMNSDIYHIALLPRLMQAHNKSPEQYERQARALAEILQMPAEDILKKMREDRTFLYLKKNVSAWAAEHIKALAITGVDMEYDSKRFYPDGMNFAHVIGYTDWQGIGRSGIEYVKHDKLDSKDGEVRYIRAGGKDAVAELQHQPAVPGNNVYLTLDRRLQYEAFKALAVAAQKHDARSAAVVLMDVQSGDILALANYPSFNPNHIRKSDRNNQINHALADQVAPGSTIKPFVAALALEHKAASPSEIFPTKRPLKRHKLRVKDAHIRENLDMAGIIRKSSNIGAVLLAERVGKAPLENLYRTLGIGGGKVLGFGEESAGLLRPSEQWRQTDFVTHAYGYGFALTMPQLLRAYSVFASDGLLVSPRLWQDAPAEAKKQVFSPATARAVRGMMEEVVSADGTARRAAIPGYRVAGKTGTTFKWVDGKWDDTRRRVFFVGMAPASAPRYLAVVMVDEPKKNGDTGGAVAAPVFRALMQNALLFGGVRPDALPQETPQEVLQEAI